MKLAGVHFRDFANFEECYVPLGRAIQVLVGKNNSGKTALLRGLSMLRSIPVGDSSADAIEAVPPDVFKYARNNPEGADIPLQVDFEFDSKDANLIGSELARLPKVSSSKKRILRFRLRAVATANIIDLEGADLLLDDGKIPVLIRDGSTMVHQLYNSNESPAGRVQLAVILNRGGQTTSSEWTRPVFARREILAPLYDLKRTRIVDAHRMPWPSANMQATDSLAANVQNLAPFLDTISGSNRRKAREIEAFVTRVFPEVEFVNAEKRQTSVSLTISRQDTEPAFPLTHCGTGVEQVIAIAAFVLTSPRGSTLLLDEPHAYLHPTAEREVMAFLQEHREHRYVISSHSAILINSVTPDCIIDVASAKTEKPSAENATGALLHSLGYKNSDLLFSDRLIFVEGESDQEILPILLKANPAFSPSQIARTGFPKMNGDGRLRGTTRQTSLIFFEKFVAELGRTSIPRLYLFDGDCENDGRRILRDTPILSANGGGGVGFLQRREIENYFLVPSAIESAIREIADGEEKDVLSLTNAAVTGQLQQLLSSEDPKVFPDGKTSDPLKIAKGSVILSRIFERYGLRYRKRNEGRLLARLVNRENQPDLEEIWELVEKLFEN